MAFDASQQPLLDPRAAIASLIAAWADAWNAHDMEQAVQLVTRDVNFVNVAGRWLKGADEFLSYHREVHRTQMRESRWANLGHEIKPLNDDLVLVHLEWTISGDRDLDGTPRARRHGIFTWLVIRYDDQWRIGAGHNTNLRSDTRHRLSSADAGNAEPHVRTIARSTETLTPRSLR
jgi:uncharacterized protein (TIGR02246 family)